MEEIEVELTVSALVILSLSAHKADEKLNDHLIKIISKYLKKKLDK